MVHGPGRRGRWGHCYNSTAPNWYQTLLEWHYHTSARKPRQLWFWWYAIKFSNGPELRWLQSPYMDIGNPKFQTPFGAPLVHMEDTNKIIIIIMIMIIIYGS
jgi:hypothetical protein